MKNYHPQVKADLQFVFRFFPTNCLKHVVSNRRRLVRRAYDDGRGGGCLFRLLSELLPPDRQIGSKEQLTKFFTGSSGPIARELPVYQPARWLVRIVDGDICQNVRERYGEEMVLLDWNYVVSCLEEEIRRRESAETTRIHRQEPSAREAACGSTAI